MKISQLVKSRKKQKKYSEERKTLQWRMIRMLLIGWLLPLFLLTLIISMFITTKVDRQIERATMESVGKAAEIMKVQLEVCEKTSKDASYRKAIYGAYKNYAIDGDENIFREQVLAFLRQQYQFDSYCKTAVLIFPEYPDMGFYTINNGMNGNYRDIEYFEECVKSDLIKYCEQLDTKTELICYNDRIYMIRNLVDTEFRPYAILSLELELDSLKESFWGIWGYENATIYKNGEVFMAFDSERIVPLDNDICSELGGNYLIFHKNGKEDPCIYARGNMYNAIFDVAVSLDDAIIYAEINTITYIFAILLVFMIPLIYLIFVFFHRRVNRPVQELVAAFDLVCNGQFGVQIEETSDSEEFQYMKKSFNHMSMQLRDQFEKIYKEEIALRDARIMALQSQINPHFLNNTLEIINWEARLNENFKVSQMIEALSTMLEATMNRRSKQLNTVVEEMEYVDAYLYIIKQRFGDKLHYTKEIDESLLNVKIPKLIVQPIVENAVEHGMDTSRQGKIKIRVYQKKEDIMCIEVEDNGSLDEKDIKRIHTLLYEELDPLNEKHVSLGIRNVDRRLKMIYGDKFGLIIKNNQDNHTVSTILVKMDNKNEQ